MNEAAEVDVKESEPELKRKPGRPRRLSEDERAELERFRMEEQKRIVVAEEKKQEEARYEAAKRELQAKQEKTKAYINVSRGRLYTGVETLVVKGKEVKTMGILYPRDWVGDILPRHGAKKMELTLAQAEGFGDKLVEVG